MEQEYYHACSEGLEKSLIFNNKEEYITGMNHVPICLQKFEVVIICFCLMGNHFHFILRGSMQECLGFANEFKRMCSMMIKRSQNGSKSMKDVEIQVKRIHDRTYLENAIAYVLRNPMVAGYRMLPHNYPWGSGDAYFRRDYAPVGKRVDSMSARDAMKLLKSKAKLPGDYIIDNTGMVSPLCYVDYKDVEKVFGHPSRFLGALSAKKEAEFEIFLGIAERYTPDMEELKASVRELIELEFGVKAVSQLSMEQRIRLCGLMRRNFRASRKQIAMITRLNMETINSII